MTGTGFLGESQLSACIFDLATSKMQLAEASMPITLHPHRHVPVPHFRGNSQRSFCKLPLAFFPGFWALITFLALSSGPAYAGWVLTSGDDEAGLTVYVDPDTIRRNGNLAKMWQLYDYKTVQTVAGDSLLSFKRFNEYDCTEERTRTLGYTWFSGNMGLGKVVYSTAEHLQWEQVAPRSINHSLWKVACNKK